MHKKFDNHAIEKKWQEKWVESGIYKTDIQSSKPKAYVLDMFPYPSGEGLHVGHPKGYIATDVYSRFKKMSGYEVLHPMGWDAFGLPAENFAIKHKVHPRVAVEKNIANFKTQLAELGFNYDWDKEINTTDPEFVKWTQWIFLRLLEKGLAHESYEPINWCPSCQTGLANEDLESDGTCERCGSVVEKKPMRQWILKITKYADRMLADLDTLNWPEHIKEAQRNWIGRSEGAEITFKLSTGNVVTVFTTRPDTLFGATFLVLAPEHPLIEELYSTITNQNEVGQYIKISSKKEEKDRLDATKEKTGVQLEGITATNPANGEQIPVFIADYVIASYGTGALMAVPAHDQRDFEFAQKFKVPVIAVLSEKTPTHVGAFLESKQHPGTFLFQKRDGEAPVFPNKIATFGGGIEAGESSVEALVRELNEELELVVTKQSIRNSYGYHADIDDRYLTHFLITEIDEEKLSLHEGEAIVRMTLQEALAHPDVLTEIKNSITDFILTQKVVTSESSVLINSHEFTGMRSDEAKHKIVEKVGGKMTNTYRLKDWVFSRQRYWGEPIPVVHCPIDGIVSVPDSELPVRLPEVEHYEPTGTGESPLADIANWVTTTCPKCGGVAKRETNTMPQWAGSSWYYLRFADPHNHTALIDPEIEKKWLPVDVYVGGDHAVRHLIYARFWHKFLYDINVVHTIEPFSRLEFLGFILAEDGRKMSKRWGNIINPTDIVKINGADALRVYEMFMGPFENTIAWSKDGIVGAQRFLERVNGLHEHITETELASITKILHKTISKVTTDIEEFKFNTAISSMMIFLNAAEKEGVTKKTYQTFLTLLAPFAPHITEELWANQGNTTSIHLESFPHADMALATDDEVTLAVQINGKMRGNVTVPTNAGEIVVIEKIQQDSSLAKYLETEIQKVVYVPGKIINILVKIQ